LLDGDSPHSNDRFKAAPVFSPGNNLANGGSCCLYCVLLPSRPVEKQTVPPVVTFQLEESAVLIGSALPNAPIPRKFIVILRAANFIVLQLSNTFSQPRVDFRQG
jgi:hypothetical protein